ncbi:unnamed protein product [Calicophoron daubneyi]|uniref:RING-type E3 ubiquitin transferase n=1 Tax=Calicophoron daubneyi TaxID=300641 RepID=A0AAV2SZT1_CALDB
MMTSSCSVSYDLAPCARPWATLQATYSNTVLNIGSDVVTIGSDPDCNVVFSNESVSPTHCILMRDPDGQIWLSDMSERGTVVNDNTVREDTVKLCSGDTFYVFTDKDSPSDNLGFAVELTDIPLESSPTSPPDSECKIPQNSSSEAERPSRSLFLDTDDPSIEACLTCVICGSIYYKCCSVQPCLHNFCTVCWLQWREVNNICPTCRANVTSFANNHQLGTLVDLYLQKHPDKDRSKKEKEEIDKEIEILKLRNPPDRLDNSSNPHLFLGLSYAQPYTPAGCVVCTWIPGASLPTGHCRAHDICACCQRPVPMHQESSGEVNNVQCFFCRRSFCSLINTTGCTGCTPTHSCLMRLRDLSNTSLLPSNLLLNNSVETSILLDYLAANSISVQDFIKECLDNIGPSEFGGVVTSPDSPVCRSCSTCCLAQLAYGRRAAIPPSHLPARVVSRPDCYYGRRCRTQQKNLGHAQRYNHICEQTRFS